MALRGFIETSGIAANPVIFGLSKRERLARKERKRKAAEEKAGKKQHELDARIRKQLRDAGFSDADIDGLMKRRKKK